MLSTLQTAIRRKGIHDGLRWAAWETLRGVHRPLANWAQRHLHFLFLGRGDLMWHARERSDLYFYGESKTLSFELPLQSSTAQLERFMGAYSLPRPFVAGVRNARLIGPYPVATVEQKIIVEATVFPSMPVLNLAYTGMDVMEKGPRQTFGGGRRHFETAVLLYNPWNSGYWHWVMDTLTRLEGVEAYADRTGRRPTLIVGPDFGGFQRETLELLGYTPNDWVEWRYLSATVDELVVPMGRPMLSNRQEGGLSPMYLDWLRDRLAPAVRERVDEGRFSPYVYISRDDADRRSVSNEEMLVEQLSEYGFERYRLSEMDTAETIALMIQAKVIVAPHGAGLTDIAFADDASVIELSRGEAPNTWVYYLLSQVVGLRYRQIACAVDGPDMWVDVDEVVAAVEAEL
jgi:hypothetical protein